MFKWIKHIILFCTFFSISLLGLDLIFQNSKIISGIQSSYNPSFDFQLKKNYKAYFFNEGFGVYYSDSSGLLSYNPNQEISYNFYGDSYIEAQQVFQRHHFGEIVADSLGVTIRNFGQSAMNLEGMFSRYFNVKDKYPAQKHVFFISDDDFDTDDLKNFIALPQFNLADSVLNYSLDLRPFGLKQKIENSLGNSAILALARQDLKIIRSNNFKHMVFDKFSPSPLKTNRIYTDLIRPNRVQNLLNILSSEPNVIMVYRGKRPLSKAYKTYFENSGFNPINLEQHFQENGGNNLYYYHGVTKSYGHWNLEGHKLIGEFLSHEF